METIYGNTRDNGQIKKLDHDDHDSYDKYIGAQLILNDVANNDGNIATVKRRATDQESCQIGTGSNPLFDTCLCELNSNMVQPTKFLLMVAELPLVSGQHVPEAGHHQVDRRPGVARRAPVAARECEP